MDACGTDQDTGDVPLAGQGDSRQTRRLQIRNARFTGTAVPTRRVTPKSIASSAWSTTSELHGVSDLENLAPNASRNSSGPAGTRRSSGILQEISNSTFKQPKRQRPRLPSISLFNSDAVGLRSPEEDGLRSSPPPRTAIRPRAVKTRTRATHARRSISGETSRYIEHLEAELASAQSQLSSMTAPITANDKSSKLRDLHIETRQLQQELDEWECKYEARVQEELDKHFEAESQLRSHIRTLEKDIHDAHSRVADLESQLEAATYAAASVEAANVNLEKRLEIMSELLATSPGKLDIHAETPGNQRRQQRPQSLCPRFPTASSLASSPDHHPRTSPASPTLTFARYSPHIPSSPRPQHYHLPPLDLSFSHRSSDAASDADSVFSETAGTVNSMTSAETHNSQQQDTPVLLQRRPWSLPPPLSTNTHFAQPSRPVRRMRRFGAGSTGPKPLILPTTSYAFPSSATPIEITAPGLERRDTTPVFFAPGSREREAEEPESPVVARRRISMEVTLTRANLQSLHAVEPSSRKPNEELVVVLSSEIGEGGDATVEGLSSEAGFCEDEPALFNFHQADAEGAGKDEANTSKLDESEDDILVSDPFDTACGYDSGRRLSLIEVTLGRSLMDELDTARTSDVSASTIDSTNIEVGVTENGEHIPIEISTVGAASIQPCDVQALGTFSTSTNAALNPLLPTQPLRYSTHSRRGSMARSRPHSRSSSSVSVTTISNINTASPIPPGSASPSILTRFRLLFSDLWRSPVEVARYLIQKAQMRMRIPAPLLNVQWWLVGVLLGPMAKRRLLSPSSSSPSCSSSRGRRGLREGVGSLDDEILNNHGTFRTSAESQDSGDSGGRETPTGDGHTESNVALMAKSKNHAHAVRTGCLHHDRHRHSPWLWIKFSITLAFAIGAAFKDGPGSLLKASMGCSCLTPRRGSKSVESIS